MKELEIYGRKSCSLFFLIFFNPLSFGMGDPVDARPPWRGPRGFPLRAGHILLLFFFHSFSLSLSEGRKCPYPKVRNWFLIFGIGNSIKPGRKRYIFAFEQWGALMGVACRRILAIPE